MLHFVDSKKKHRVRVAVTKHLTGQVLDVCDRGPHGGHFSVNRTYKSVAGKWWWEGMYGATERFVKNCPECAIVSSTGRQQPPPLHPIPVKRPFQIVGVDIMDLPVTTNGHKHVVVFQDYLTKWPMVYAIPDQKAHRITRILVDEIIPFYGVPECLLSDRGTNLLSHLMRDLCQMLGIKKLNTTAYPECDGMVERFNRTLKSMLRKHAARFGVQWDRFLSGVLYAYRNTPHDSTGEKPSYLLFGTDLRSPTEAAYLPPSELEWNVPEDYREEVTTMLSSARSLAVESIQKAQEVYKRYFDRKAKQQQFRVGDQVLMRFPSEEQGKLRKLSRPWHGPYRVTARNDPDISIVKVYFPEEAAIQVHQTRVCFCPPGFPPGYYRYGANRHSEGNLSRWVERLVEAATGTAGVQDKRVSPDPQAMTMQEPVSDQDNKDGEISSTEDNLECESPDNNLETDGVIGSDLHAPDLYEPAITHPKETITSTHQDTRAENTRYHLRRRVTKPSRLHYPLLESSSK